MTRQQIELSEFIYKKILPVLQKTERTLFYDDRIDIVIYTSKYDRSLTVSMDVRSNDSAYSVLCSKTFRFYNIPSYNCEKSLMKELRGVGYFVENWKKRLSKKTK